MAYLKYYRDERKRHSALQAAGVTFEDACEAIERLAKKYEVEIRKVERTSGSRHSHYSTGSKLIRLNCDHLNWLTVIHEFAHAMDDADREREMKSWTKAEDDFCREMRERFPLPGITGKFAFADQDTAPRATGGATDAYKAWLRDHPRPASRKWHSARHAEFVDILARVVVESGWMASIPAERAARDLKRIEKRQAVAAYRADPAVVRAKKIEKRQKQIAGLEAAIKRCWIREKNLNTRLARARKSLAALERAASKKEEAS